MARILFTQAQIDFASELSKQTGGNFYTILGWELAEGGPPDNPLNIGPGKHFGDPKSAADATAKIIQTENQFKDILSSFQAKYASDDKAIVGQAKSIAFNTHWNVLDPKKYSPSQIQTLRLQYEHNIQANAAIALYQGVQPNSKIDSQGNIQNPPDNPGGILGGIDSAIGSIGDLAHAIAAPFEWIQSNWERIFLVIGGGILVIIAVINLSKSDSNTFTFARGE